MSSTFSSQFSNYASNTPANANSIETLANKTSGNASETEPPMPPVNDAPPSDEMKGGKRHRSSKKSRRVKHRKSASKKNRTKKHGGKKHGGKKHGSKRRRSKK